MSDGCPGEASVTGGTGLVDPLEADEAGADPHHVRRRLPAFRGHLRQGLLQLGELVHGGWPGRHTDSVRRSRSLRPILQHARE